jgi:hypothetical protein
MFTPSVPAKWLFLAFIVLAPVSAILSPLNDATPRPVEWGVVVAIPLMLVCIVAFISRRLEFRRSERGLGSQRLFTLLAASFVLVGTIGFVRLAMNHLVAWHDDAILFGVCFLFGLSLLCAIIFNRRLTSR